MRGKVLHRAVLRPGLACAIALSACAAGPEEVALKDATALDRAPSVDASARDASDLGVPRDVPQRPDSTVVPSDVVAIVDAPVGVDAPPAADAPAPVDASPVDVGCTLPPPIARPPAALPSGEDVVRAVAAEHPDWLRDSCVPTGGSWRFLFEVLRRGRAVDPRWGLDRRTGPVSGDIVTYFYGDGCPEGRREVYMVDVITRHCAREGIDAPAAPGWIDRTAEGGLWTLMGYDGAPPPDAGAPDAMTVDVPPTRVPLPDGSGVVNAVARELPELLRNSCVAMGGNNDFLFEVVRRLRRSDTRWGLNWKRGRIGDMSQDVVNYYYGPAGAPMESSPDTYVIDMIGGHCGPTPSPSWIDVTGVGGALALWTLAGRTDL